ncbi:MAG: T9SS type A sorting domain-containing protein, partial [Bacteroidetes bacterium]|nr:T9SS type A sorting domain-containing protein [Bacteroidota bacterium]
MLRLKNVVINASTRNMELDIFSINGKKVVVSKSISVNQSYSFDVSGWSGGIYYCRVKSGEKYSFRR